VHFSRIFLKLGFNEELFQGLFDQNYLFYVIMILDYQILLMQAVKVKRNVPFSSSNFPSATSQRSKVHRSIER
jgi:hypothetical protein